MKHAVESPGAVADRTPTGVVYVEVLVAMLFLAVSLLALVPLLVTASGENASAGQLLFATTAAHDKAEELKTVAAVDLATGSETLWDGPVTYTRSWVVSSDTPATGMTAVTVTVRPENEPRGGARPAVVTFYRVR